MAWQASIKRWVTNIITAPNSHEFEAKGLLVAYEAKLKAGKPARTLDDIPASQAEIVDVIHSALVQSRAAAKKQQQGGTRELWKVGRRQLEAEAGLRDAVIAASKSKPVVKANKRFYAKCAEVLKEAHPKAYEVERKLYMVTVIDWKRERMAPCRYGWSSKPVDASQVMLGELPEKVSLGDIIPMSMLPNIGETAHLMVEVDGDLIPIGDWEEYESIPKAIAGNSNK
jgi:hypothetical protein